MAEPRKFPRTILAALMMAAELIATHPAVASSSLIEDRWLTDDRKAVVLIASCGAALCGTIHQIRDKGPDVPKTDVYNPVPVLRSRSLIGLPILFGFRPNGGNWTNGHAYDPKSGKTYRASLHLASHDQLVVTGCIFVFCQSKYWTRLAPDRER